jgi:hypothetical protein
MSAFERASDLAESQHRSIAVSLRKFALFSAVLAVAGAASCLYAQGGDPKDVLLKKLNDQFVLTSMTADGTDVVKAGSTVTLHISGLQMCSVQAKIPMPNTYKDGRLSQGKFAWGMAMGLAQPSLPTVNVPLRSFVADEKFWVTAVGVEKGVVVFKFYSDVYGDDRYYAQLAFPFDKKGEIPVDDLLKAIAEVVTAEPPNAEPATAGASTASEQSSPAAVSAPVTPPPAASMPDIAPPPPPADTPPPTIALGQTMDQVTTAFGQPLKLAKMGTKVIFYYKDMKVTFTDGKVSDVE